MVSAVWSAALKGLGVEFVRVEADVSEGLPFFHLVGYLASEVKEAGERVRSAIRNTEFKLPPKKMVVNLSPAHVRKRGTAFDLPIAVAILDAMGMVNVSRAGNTLFVGELGLDGTVKKTSGILPIVAAAKKGGFSACVLPVENEEEGRIVEGIQVIGVSHLKDVCDFLIGKFNRDVELKRTLVENKSKHVLDYSDIRGQIHLKRAVEVAVSGGHNIMLIGPPGVGKTMIAKRIPSILPTLSLEESLTLSSIYSIAGELDPHIPLMTTRPFREIHHSISRSALLGGGAIPRPGEISMATHGVLFMDELAEFPKSILELMRQPMDSHKIRIVRNRQECEFPADFLLVATMNPCPCGHYPDLNKCTCSGPQIRNYWSKISSPLLDRIDICAQAEAIPYEHLQEGKGEETSRQIRDRVVVAREIQKERYRGCGLRTNADLTAGDIEHYCALGAEEKKMMELVFKKMELSARGYHKILCVARTIADLSGGGPINSEHLAEAISYRLPGGTYGRC